MAYHRNELFDWLLKNYKCEKLKLSESISEKNFAVAIYLIENGEDVNEQDYIQRTPLHHACGQCSSELVKYLISKGAKKNAYDKYRKLPLNISILKHDDESIKLLK